MAAKMNIGTIMVQLLLEDGNFGPDLKKAESRLDAFGGNVVDLAADLDKILTRAFVAAGAAVAGLGTAAVVTGAAFEKQMSRVAAVSGATREELALLTTEARRIGSETMFSATQAAQGMEALAQAGFTPRQIITATADAMALAGASGMELNAATELVAATLTQFGMKADEAGRASDVLTQAASGSLFTVQDLGVALRYAGSAGAAMGYSLEEVTAAVAQFRNIGLTGEMAGTNFRSMMEGLANPTKLARAEIESMGLSVDQLNPSLHDFDEIMQALTDSNMTVSNSFRIFGSTSGANIARLTQAWEESKAVQTGYQQTLQGLMNSSGAAGAQFANMADNVAGKWDQLSSAVEEGLLVVFEAMKGPLTRLMDEIGDRVALLTKLFAGSAGTATEGLDRIVDGIVAVVDQMIIWSPWLEEIAALMFAALVGAKGVQWAGALASLAKAFGVDLVQAATSAATAIRGASAASALFSVTAIGAILAGIALLTAAVVKLIGTYTGATRAARELAGEIAGQKALDAASKDEIKALEAKLALTQEQIRQKVVAGEVLTKEENQIRRLTAATAYNLLVNGELLEINGHLELMSQQSTQFRNESAEAMLDEAAAAEKVAERLRYLRSQYQEAGAFDSINDIAQGGKAGGFKLMGGPLDQASKAAGTAVDSFESLNEQIAIYEGRAEAARKASASISAALTDEQIAANEAAQSAKFNSEEKVRAAAEASAAAKEAAADEATASKTAKASSDSTQAALDAEINLRRIRNDEIAFSVDMEEKYAAAAAASARAAAEIAKSLSGATRVDQIDGDALRAASQAYTDALAAVDPHPLWTEFFRSAEDASNKWVSNFGKAIGNQLKAVGGAIVGMLPSPMDLVGLLTGGLGSVSGIMGLIGGIAADGGPGKVPGAAGSEAVNGVIDQAILFVETLASELPSVLSTLVKRIPDVLDAVVKGVPQIVQALVDNIPTLVMAIVHAIPTLLTTILSALPDLIAVVADGIAIIIRALPEIITAILVQLPDIITALVRAIPVIIEAVIDALPKIAIALAEAMPEIVIALAEAVPYLAGVIIGKLPAIAWAFVRALWALLKGIVVSLAELVVHQIKTGFGLFGGKGNKGGGFLGGLFSKKGRHPDGIPWVPHTMATVLEPGEAVIDAVSNWERQRTNYGTPGPHPTGGSGAGSVEVTVMLDNQTVDAAQASAMADGRMPKMARAMRGTSTRIGFKRGRLNVWT